MGDRLRICAYWEARRETIDGCAERLRAFLTRIAARSELLTTWYETGWTRRKALEKTVRSTKSDLLDLLRRGRNRRDLSDEVIEELGFDVSLWNGRREPELSGLSITCGLYSELAGVGSNNVLVCLPEELGGLADSREMAHLLYDVVECWEPQRASVCSELAMDSRGFDASRPFVDWMVYVAGLRLAEASLPVTAQVRQIGRGTMIVVDDHSPSALAEEHLKRVRQVQKAISDASP